MIVWETETLYRGERYSICVLVRDGRCATTEFLEKTRRDKNSGYGSIIRELENTAQRGPSKSKKKFEMVGTKKVFEIKTPKIRVFGFFDGAKLILLTHGWMKEGNDRKQDREIKKAEKTRKQYLESSGARRRRT